MSETLLISILGVASTLLSGLLSFVLGQRFERQRQTLTIRSEMLKPIEEWLHGAERMIGILGDTLSSVTLEPVMNIGLEMVDSRHETNWISK